MANRPTKNLRIAFVPSDAVAALFSELSQVSGKPKASLVSEILDDIAPVIMDQLQAMKKIAARPEEARAHIEALADSAVDQIVQAKIEFDNSTRVRGPDRKKRARRVASATT